MSSRVPKRFAQPAKGYTVETEPDNLKAARLLGLLRHMVARNSWGTGITVDGAQFIVVRFRPTPDGPHNPDADLSGQEL